MPRWAIGILGALLILAALGIVLAFIRSGATTNQSGGQAPAASSVQPPASVPR